MLVVLDGLTDSVDEEEMLVVLDGLIDSAEVADILIRLDGVTDSIDVADILVRLDGVVDEEDNTDTLGCAEILVISDREAYSENVPVSVPHELCEAVITLDTDSWAVEEGTREIDDAGDTDIEVDTLGELAAEYVNKGVTLLTGL
jgi:hypothetical protein